MKATRLTAFAVFFGMSVTALHAANISWTGAKNNKWSDPGNWGDGTAVPTASDTAVFNVSEATTIDVDAPGCTCLYISINANSKALTFDGTETLTLVRASDNITVENNNRGTYMTTFNCPVFNSNGGNSADGKDAFYPGIVYNGLVTVNGGLIYFRCDKTLPSAENAKTVFRGGLVCACTRGNGNYLYFASAQNAMELDFADPTLAVSGIRGFTLQGGILRIKSGKLSVNSSAQSTSSSASIVEVDGGTFNTGSNNLGSHFVFKSGRYIIGSVNTTGAATTPNELGFTDGVIGADCETQYALVNGSTAFKLFSPNQPLSELTLNGVFTATNATAASYPRPYFCPANTPRSTLKGTGTFWARAISFDGGTSKTSPLTFEGITLVLGDGGIDSGAQWYQALRLDGATLKGYADITGIQSKGGHTIFLAGKTTIDTADARDASVKRTFTLTSATTTAVAEEDLELNVKGGGTVKMNWSAADAQSCTSLTVGEATTLVLGGDATVSAGALALGNGAALTLPATTRGALDIDGFSLTGSATITVSIPSGTKQSLIPVILGGKLTTAGLTVVLDNKSTTTYSYTVCDGNLYVHTSAVNPTAGVAEWTGGGDGTTWSDAQNWVVAPESGANVPVYFNGFSNLNVTVDQSGLSYKQLIFRASAADFNLSGKPLTLTSNQSGGNSAIEVLGFMPITIANDITLTGSGTAISTDPKGYVTLSGTLTAPYWTSLDGVFAISGTATFGKLSYMNGHSDSHLIVENGGTVNLTGNPDLRSASLSVKAGGTLNLTETCTGGWDWLNGGCAIALDGRINVAKGFGASTTSTPKARFTGEGRLDIGYTTIPAAANWRGEMVGVTLNVSNRWDTTLAGKEAYAAALTLNKGTLGAKGDFTYGVSSEADAASITTAAADRALKLNGACAVDTQDPDSAVAHTITFTDPIDGSAGSLTKKGAGDLVLMADSATATNNLAGGLTLAAGRVVFAGPCAENVAGVVTAAGGGLGLTKAARKLLTSWTTVLKATSVDGTLADPTGRAIFRVVEQADYVEIQAKANRKGLMAVIR